MPLLTVPPVFATHNMLFACFCFHILYAASPRRTVSIKVELSSAVTSEPAVTIACCDSSEVFRRTRGEDCPAPPSGETLASSRQLPSDSNSARACATCTAAASLAASDAALCACFCSTVSCALMQLGPCGSDGIFNKCSSISCKTSLKPSVTSCGFPFLPEMVISCWHSILRSRNCACGIAVMPKRCTSKGQVVAFTIVVKNAMPPTKNKTRCPSPDVILSLGSWMVSL
mmetsp:Transcript_12585/g.28487  ORF Transcript_12585/g.28487 Transcript_12585/m.28487 type:complete len:229 (+) Transcript_12585:1639-2325(+)